MVVIVQWRVVVAVVQDVMVMNALVHGGGAAVRRYEGHGVVVGGLRYSSAWAGKDVGGG